VMLRSHDRYNTTIYGLDDRYRAVFMRRDVLYTNDDDLAEHRDLVASKRPSPAGNFACRKSRRLLAFFFSHPAFKPHPGLIFQTCSESCHVARTGALVAHFPTPESHVDNLVPSFTLQKVMKSLNPQTREGLFPRPTVLHARSRLEPFTPRYRQWFAWEIIIFTLATVLIHWVTVGKSKRPSTVLASRRY
jgi:hypothetical protein